MLEGKDRQAKCFLSAIILMCLSFPNSTLHTWKQQFFKKRLTPEMLTWRAGNSPYLPLHKEAQDSQHQAQLTMGVSRQTDRHGHYKRQKKARAGRQRMLSWPPCWAGSWGHSLGAHPPHQGISISLLPPLCLPRHHSAGCPLLVRHCIIHLW